MKLILDVTDVPIIKLNNFCVKYNVEVKVGQRDIIELMEVKKDG